VLKLTKIGQGSGFEEVEIPISQNDVEKAVKLFEALGLNEVQRSFQKRHNYLYKEIEIALKYSDAWGYHMELEKIVGDKNSVPEAERQIREIASEFGAHIMTDEELKEFTEKKDKEYRQGSSS